MLRFFNYSFVILCLLALAPESVRAAKKPKVIEASPQEYAQLPLVREVVGHLGSIDAGPNSRSLTLYLEYQYPKGTSKGKTKGTSVRPLKQSNLAGQLQTLQRQEQQILKTKDPVKRQQKWQQLMVKIHQLQMHIEIQQLQAQKRLAKFDTGPFAGLMAYGPNVKLATAYKAFELEMLGDLVVRRWSLPVEKDDKGKVKKLSQNEIAVLKGKKNLPGYAAHVDDLGPDQIVKLFLVTPKPEKKNKNAAGKDPLEKLVTEKKDKKADDKAAVARPQVRMILILSDADEPVTAGKGKKKKKTQ